MDLHRVRRLAWVLVASQIRASGRGANPKSWTGQPPVFAWGDLAIFGVAFAVAEFAVRSAQIPAHVLTPLVAGFLPFLPIYAVGAVLVAGVLFELTATARFAGSDAANWLPMSPDEYVLASSSAIAYTYSPAIALILGAVTPLALASNLGVPMLLTGVLCLVGLFEGAFLVEMLRSVSQRGLGGSAQRGRLGRALAAVALVLVIVLLQLAFNPVFLLDSLQGLTAFGQFTAFIPTFWGTFSVLRWMAGDPSEAVVFAVAQVAFAGLLLYAATALRARYWSVTPQEYKFEPHRFAAGHPLLRGIGLSHAEAAIVTKDFQGYFRRREMLPLLVLPLVILVVVFIEAHPGGAGLSSFTAFITAGWVIGFFALLLAETSVGQERKAVWAVYAAPLPPYSLFRAKLVAAITPSWIASAGVGIAVAVLYGVGPLVGAALSLTGAVAGFAVALWGLGFAARYSDFQERPRPQYLRPGAMLVSSLSGMGIVFAILIPASFVVLSSGVGAAEGVAATAAVAGCVITVGWVWARSGFAQLFRELPF